ncbi:methenyltetrahydrofolate synthase domain-containing protein-like [Mya arenaria]|uniref:methenyltetrahydrofolate synthase domain-containing protein-like n=1 Tax=Mya arenaria TaxID=6604 RepID=UPI0022E6B977|nr:methenyltetrahydrofolate synthase domain-containing protein-like [Mya arenaria]XP_052764412.1 methenyltetrahydrofolate synthase domain-containing protein-like [Mya arenaria]
MSQKLPAESVKEMGPDDVTKPAIRNAVWKYIEENDLADFPRPVNRRIPNVKGAATAAELIPTMQEFKKAQVVKINPDKPQEQARFLTLDAGKTLLVPTPRLRSGLFNKIAPPAGATKDILRICATSQGVREYSSTMSLDEKLKVDLVIIGSVAVSRSGLRIGKGEGFADLEWAMMSSMKAVNTDTVVITTVNDCQIVDIPDSLIEDHDLTVDYIVTPQEIIKCNRTRSKPSGIIWSKLEPLKLKRVPILRKLWQTEKDAGVDVTLKDGAEFDLEAAEKEDAEREERRQQEGGDQEGGRRRYRRRYGGGFGGRGRGRGRGRGGRGGRPTSGDRDRTESEGGENTDGEKGAGEGSTERKQRRRPRRYRRRPNQRRSKDSEGEADGSGDGGERRERRERTESEGEGRDQRRTQRRFRPRRGRQPALFVGGLPRSLRVSTFKTEVRGREVDPLRVIWHGGNGHAFLQFENSELMESALSALGDLNINGKKLRVEEAKGRDTRQSEDMGEATEQRANVD